MPKSIENLKKFGSSLELRKDGYFSVDPETEAIAFTEAGRRYYGYWFNRNGLSLDEVANVKDFKLAIDQVNSVALAISDSRIEHILVTDPNLHPDERAFFSSLIGKPELAAVPHTFPEVPANVVPLRTLKE